MKNAEGRNEYMDLAKKANLISHQIVAKDLKTHLESNLGHSTYLY